jgi:hypothetical protein
MKSGRVRAALEVRLARDAPAPAPKQHAMVAGDEDALAIGAAAAALPS